MGQSQTPKKEMRPPSVSWSNIMIRPHHKDLKVRAQVAWNNCNIVYVNATTWKTPEVEKRGDRLTRKNCMRKKLENPQK